MFEKAFRAWNRFDPARASASTWLTSIARNVLVDHFRRRRESLLGDEAVAHLVDESADPRTQNVSSELSYALSTLTPREQTVLAMRYGGDMTGAEIADTLELKTDNVHQILSRALRRLRDRLGEIPASGSAERAGAGEPQ